MSIIYSIVGFLIAIAVLVAVHEFGHMWVARKLGVKVLRYSIGFGKPLWKKRFGADNTEYVVAAVPLGGYVQMLGQGDNNVRPEERHRAFDYQPIWKRSLIVAAGPGINFLFAIVLFAILGTMSQQQLAPEFGEISSSSELAKAGVKQGDKWISIDGRNIDHFSDQNLYLFNRVLSGKTLEIQIEREGSIKTVQVNTKGMPIYDINPRFLAMRLGFMPIQAQPNTNLAVISKGSAAERAGLKAGDKIVSIDGRKIETWDDLVAVISTSPDKELELQITRGENNLLLKATPDSLKSGEKEVGRLGVGPQFTPIPDRYIVDVKYSLPKAILKGAEQTWYMSLVTVKMFWKMVTLQVSHKNISGPITIADYAGQAMEFGFSSYLSMLAVISISLGVMNLLPIPMLDGGHLLMYAVETVAGKNIAEKFFEVGQRVGIFLLLCLMSLAFYNDIFRLLN